MSEIAQLLLTYTAICLKITVNLQLKYTWEISENSLAFRDIKLSINDNDLSASVRYKPTNCHNYLLHSPSHP